MAYCKEANDGLCHPAITVQARQLVSTVCILGGAECPLIGKDQAQAILGVLKSDPTVTIRLESQADEIPHYSLLGPDDYARMRPEDVFNRKRDLDVLRNLGLVPGDVRRARYLYELLFDRIKTPDGICAYDTPGWEGCPHARSGAYERIRDKGWQAVVHARTGDEMREYRERNVERIKNADRLFLRPHHMMCYACWYAGGEGQGLRSNDTLAEIGERIRKDPDIPITLVEGPCMACDCCDGFHPPNGRCVHTCGLIRDYKKDLDLFQKLGIMPGAKMKARDFITLLFDCVQSTREICGYGDGVVTSEEWRICSSPEGSPGYEKTRQTGLF